MPKLVGNTSFVTASNNTTLFVDGIDNRVGIQTDNPKASLDVAGVIQTEGLIVRKDSVKGKLDSASLYGFNPRFDDWSNGGFNQPIQIGSTHSLNVEEVRAIGWIKPLSLQNESATQDTPGDWSSSGYIREIHRDTDKRIWNFLIFLSDKDWDGGDFIMEGREIIIVKIISSEVSMAIAPH